MRATLVLRLGARAVVRLTPCRLARLLGAVETECELSANVLDLDNAIQRNGDGEIVWRFANTGRRLTDWKHGPILRALERQPVGLLPRAKALAP